MPATKSRQGRSEGLRRIGAAVLVPRRRGGYHRVAQVFLPQASRFAVDPAPFGVVVIGVVFDAFFFQALHTMVSRPVWMTLRRLVRAYIFYYTPYLLRM